MELAELPEPDKCWKVTPVPGDPDQCVLGFTGAMNVTMSKSEAIEVAHALVSVFD